MRTRLDERRARASAAGYTLIELLTVVVILSIVGLTTSYVISSSMRVYVRTAPSLDASYQAQLSIERLRRDIRTMGDLSMITAFTDTELAFSGSDGNPVSYRHAAGDLRRNGDLLARGVSAFDFDYWNSQGMPASAPTEMRLVDIDITVRSADQSSRMFATVAPRGAGFGSSGGGAVLDQAASEASARRAGNRRFELDLVSLASSDLVLASFELSSDGVPSELRRLGLDGAEIWRANGVFLPTGDVSLNRGSSAERTIAVGTRPTLRVDFRGRQSGTVRYDLTLRFTDGSSASLGFTIPW